MLQAVLGRLTSVGRKRKYHEANQPFERAVLGRTTNQEVRGWKGLVGYENTVQLNMHVRTPPDHVSKTGWQTTTAALETCVQDSENSREDAISYGVFMVSWAAAPDARRRAAATGVNMNIVVRKQDDHSAAALFGFYSTCQKLPAPPVARDYK